MKYYIVLITTIIILCIIALVIKKCLKKSNTETDISTMMITTGISLIVAAFPGTKEAVISFVAEMVGKEVTYKTDPVMIICGIVLILRRETLIKKIFWGILLDFLIPVLICFIILSIATGNWEDALIVLQEERRKCIILVLFIIFSNAIIVFAVGYCMAYSFQKDLIEKNRRNKRKEPKKNLSRKHKYRWKNKDYQLIGWLLIIVAIVFYGAYVNWQGIQNAQKQELFLTTRIDNDTYIVVMTDGDEAILEKDRTGKDGKLKICKDKYMKVDCKNLLLEKKKYRRASGDGE